MVKRRMRNWPALFAWAAVTGLTAVPALAINGGTLQVNPRNGWRAFEVITVGNDPTGDSITYAMPGSFDGIGAWMPVAATLRVQLNHETADASVSEVNLNFANLQTAIKNVITTGTTGSVTFVTSAQQAYDRWSSDGGTNWTNTTSTFNTSFRTFCSSQSYKPNTFGTGRGFRDNIYITGEESFDTTGRLFALDSINRDFYQLSGVAGSASGGLGGMPFDSYENAALLDTGETDYVALLLSPDGGSQTMKLYIGEKGKAASGLPSSSFLARNGLAYGSYYYLNDTLPALGAPSTDGFFDTTASGALSVAKLEDVDANPNDPMQAVIGIQESGLFAFDFNLAFNGVGGSFNSAGSSFSLTKLQNHLNDTDGSFGDADNVDWTAATTLNGITYSNGLIVVNEDSGTSNGETWMMTPAAGSSKTLIADTVLNINATETSGVLDVSSLVGFRPGSVLLTNNQGTAASLTVLINPNAKLAADYNSNGIVDAADYVVWRNAQGQSGAGHVADGSGNGLIDAADQDFWRAQFGRSIVAGAGSGANVSEPHTLFMVLCAAAAVRFLKRR